MARTKVTVNKKREQSHESEDRDTLMSTAKSYIWTTVGTEEGTNFKTSPINVDSIKNLHPDLSDDENGVLVMQCRPDGVR